MKKITAYFLNSINNHKVISTFRSCIYLYVLIFTLIQLPAFETLYGQDTFILPFYKMPSHLFYILDPISVFQLSQLHWWILLLLIFSILLAFFKENNRWLSILIFLTYSVLYHKTAALQNGGTNLIYLILFYLIFIDEKGENNKLNILISNLAILTIQFQICLLYFVAGFYKLQGELWMQGSAMYYVLGIEEYSHPLIINMINSDSTLLRLLNWVLLLFQLLFPILIWFKSTKKGMIILGTIFHLFIAIVIGLFDFGIAMIIAYIIFYPAQNNYLLSKTELFFNRLRNIKTIFTAQ